MLELSYHQWSFILDGAHLLSITACCVLLVTILRLDEKVRNRLFVKQMLHLVCSDLLGGASGIILNVFYLMHQGNASRGNPTSYVHVTMAFGVLAEAQVIVSMILEFQLCCGFACGYFQFRRPLPILRRLIPFSWVSGLVLSSLDQLATASFQTPLVDLIPTILTCIGFLVCAIVYSAVCVQVYRKSAPGVVVDKVAARAWAYPLSFFLTCGPMLTVMIVTDFGWQFDGDGFFLWWWRVIKQPAPYTFPWWYWIAYIFLGLNGALNCAVYVLCSGSPWRRDKARRIANRPPSPPLFAQQATTSEGRTCLSPLVTWEGCRADASFHVQFAPPQVNLIDSSFSTADTSPDCGSDSSGFADEFWAGTEQAPRQAQESDRQIKFYPTREVTGLEGPDAELGHPRR